ncbi:hypothetical protein AWH56_018720 [Anaerobacillus isosaccharinicus]|uniref:Uncharacterized protein n=1 Tax=Anaerobacillus isosaccharinicus TaxID=1532552 RepID=A0A1S2LG10_9BACI|nr:hypothetical protein [Anaerobacillus isosaccharinicus]MBA5587061.1 hypothetical protein [Anaerobacillus isosaccharinicus]MBA5587108.1 hypothetical protein [Anaerobacillus isosaccharinicus]QOY34696.1 hypothetical protein AWH56_018480 [Anaerobacillus isosaccharinicus]QOY34742.1 hypothetical protein AWH56_018720 [Anaerobacillus isosaccharinicus]
MFNRKNDSKDNIKAEILLAGQSLSFKLDDSETTTLMENLEEASYDFKRMETIKLFHPDGRLKSVINPLQISRIWFS